MRRWDDNTQMVSLSVWALIVNAGCQQPVRDPTQAVPQVTAPSAKRSAAPEEALLIITPSPVVVCRPDGLGEGTVTWSGNGKDELEVRVGSPDGSLFAQSGAQGGSKVTGPWLKDGTTFHLRRAGTQGPEGMLAMYRVSVVRGPCP